MIVTIHQPSYLPWPPFLDKGLQSDIYVLLDDVQFEKNSEQNRNRIKTAQGAAWLTVPVSRHLHTPLPEVRIPETERDWYRKHLRAIEQNYGKAPYFDVVASRLFDVLDRAWDRLLELNVAVSKLFLEFAGFAGRIVYASELGIEGSNWQRVLSISQALGAKTYLSGARGHDYLNLPAFDDAKIEVLFQRYQHREYPQLFPKVNFVPHLSALDLFMNMGIGSAAKDFIFSSSRWLTAEQMRSEKT